MNKGTGHFLPLHPVYKCNVRWSILEDVQVQILLVNIPCFQWSVSLFGFHSSWWLTFDDSFRWSSSGEIGWLIGEDWEERTWFEGECCERAAPSDGELWLESLVTDGGRLLLLQLCLFKYENIWSCIRVKVDRKIFSLLSSLSVSSFLRVTSWERRSRSKWTHSLMTSVSLAKWANIRSISSADEDESKLWYACAADKLESLRSLLAGRSCTSKRGM